MSIQFWFVCKDKECRESFSNLNLFIEHKKEKHFTEFQITNCFVFDERENPLFSSLEAVHCTTRNSLQFLVTKKETQADESPHVASAIKIEAESWVQAQAGSNLPHSYTIGIGNPAKHADNISDINLAETEIAFSGESNSPHGPYLEMIPKTEITVFENECNSAEHKTKVTHIKDNANNRIKFLNNPNVRLKRLTKITTQSASSSLNCRKIETVLSANKKHTYAKTKTNAVRQLLPAPNEPKLRFKCNLCCEKFESVRSLKLHWNACSYFHDNRHSFCVICNKLFSNSVNFEDHCLTVHRLTAKEFHIRTKFKCQLCAKKFEVYENLSLHTENHDSIEPLKSQKILHKCTEPGCAALFALPCLLNYHLEFKHKAQKY